MNQFIVTEPCYTMREKARGILAGNWNKTAVLTLIMYLIMLVPTTILIAILGEEDGNVMISIYSLIISGPLMYGYFLCLRRLTKKETFEISELFTGFELLGKLIGLTVVMYFFIFLWSLLLVIPGIIAIYRYSQAYLLLVDNPKMGIMEALRESKSLMRGNKGKLFVLQLSFIGWALLATIPMSIGIGIISYLYASYLGGSGVFVYVLTYILMVGYLWLTPYMYTADIVFYMNLISRSQAELSGGGAYSPDVLQSRIEEPVKETETYELGDLNRYQKEEETAETAAGDEPSDEEQE